MNSGDDVTGGLTGLPPGILSFMGAPALDPKTAGQADVAMFGVPFDLGTTGRSGSRDGPGAVRYASRLVRPFNQHTGVDPFALCRVADIGDAPVDPLSLDGSITMITDFVYGLTHQGTAPLAIGGDHTVSLPVLRGLAPGEPLGLVQFDAHSDTADVSPYGGKIFYASPFRRAIEEGLIDARRTVQIGIRSMLREPQALDWARAQGITIITMDDYDAMGREEVIAQARRVIGEKPAYVTFDMDALDAAHAPGTGLPEPGGLTSRDALVILRGLRGLDIVGGDVCETNPALDVAGITAQTGAYLMFDILCLLAEAKAARSG